MKGGRRDGGRRDEGREGREEGQTGRRELWGGAGEAIIMSEGGGIAEAERGN